MSSPETNTQEEHDIVKAYRRYLQLYVENKGKLSKLDNAAFNDCNDALRLYLEKHGAIKNIC